jgi:hypothetical protein
MDSCVSWGRRAVGLVRSEFVVKGDSFLPTAWWVKWEMLRGSLVNYVAGMPARKGGWHFSGLQADLRLGSTCPVPPVPVWAKKEVLGERWRGRDSLVGQSAFSWIHQDKDETFPKDWGGNLLKPANFLRKLLLPAESPPTPRGCGFPLVVREMDSSPNQTSINQEMCYSEAPAGPGKNPQRR